MIAGRRGSGQAAPETRRPYSLWPVPVLESSGLSAVGQALLECLLSGRHDLA